MVSIGGKLLRAEGRLAVPGLLATVGRGGRAGCFGKLGILIGSGMVSTSPGLWRFVLTWYMN